MEPRVLTVRMPEDEYETVRGFAFTMNMSMNDVVREALAEYLTSTGRRRQFEMLLEESRDTYRVALDKLADA